MTTSPQRNNTLRIIVSAAGVACALALIWLAVRPDTTTEAFNALADEHATRAWERPTPTPAGWEASPGSAAVDYRRAVERCVEPSALPDGWRVSIRQTILGVPEDQRFTPPPERREAASTCEQLGAASDDPVTPYLDEPTCRWLVACQGSVDLVLTGSRRENARSPWWIWDPRNEDLGPLPSTAYLPLLDALIIDAGRLGAQGDRQGQLDRLAAAARMGQDLGRGSFLLGVMVGHAHTGLALDHLQALVRDDALSEVELERLDDELRYLDRSGAHPAASLEAEFLTMLPNVARDPELRAPPASRGFDLQVRHNLVQRLLLKSTVDDVGGLFLQVIEVARTEPELRQRVALYTAAYAKINASLNPMTRQLGSSSLDNYDVKMVASHAQINLLRWAVAARLHHRRRGAWPTSADDLQQGGALPDDPLMSGPFRLDLKEGAVTIASRAPEDPTLQPYLRSPSDAASLTVTLLHPPAPPAAPSDPERLPRFQTGPTIER